MRREDTVSFLSHFLNVRAAPMLDAFRDWAQAHRFLMREFKPFADHFSYKCREVREYDELRGRFEEHAEGWQGCRFFHQAVISGRRVAVIGLVDPIPTPFGPLRVLELSEPKPMSADAGGFDHVEICPTYESIADLAAELNALPLSPAFFDKKDRPHHATWDAKIAADGTLGHRQDFILRLTSEPLVRKIGQEML